MKKLSFVKECQSSVDQLGEEVEKSLDSPKLMKPTKKPEAPISKPSPGYSTPRVYKPASKNTSLIIRKRKVRCIACNYMICVLSVCAIVLYILISIKQESLFTR